MNKKHSDTCINKTNIKYLIFGTVISSIANVILKDYVYMHIHELPMMWAVCKI